MVKGYRIWDTRSGLSYQINGVMNAFVNRRNDGNICIAIPHIPHILNIVDIQPTYRKLFKLLDNIDIYVRLRVEKA